MVLVAGAIGYELGVSGHTTNSSSTGTQTTLLVSASSTVSIPSEESLGCYGLPQISPLEANHSVTIGQARNWSIDLSDSSPPGGPFCPGSTEGTYNYSLPFVIQYGLVTWTEVGNPGVEIGPVTATILPPTNPMFYPCWDDIVLSNGSGCDVNVGPIIVPNSPQYDLGLTIVIVGYVVDRAP
jgi:hypothetical protein